MAKGSQITARFTCEYKLCLMVDLIIACFHVSVCKPGEPETDKSELKKCNPLEAKIEQQKNKKECDN